jgi:hypothetical protein
MDTILLEVIVGQPVKVRVFVILCAPIVIKGVVNAPFPTYRFSAYIPIANSQHGEGDICILVP